VTLFAAEDGNTPLLPEEQAGLIPNLATREELNEWERQNILEAYGWALDTKNTGHLDLSPNPMFASCTGACSTRRGSGRPATGHRKRTSEFPSIKSRSARGAAGQHSLLAKQPDLRAR